MALYVSNRLLWKAHVTSALAFKHEDISVSNCFLPKCCMLDVLAAAVLVWGGVVYFVLNCFILMSISYLWRAMNWKRGWVSNPLINHLIYTKIHTGIQKIQATTCILNPKNSWNAVNKLGTTSVLVPPSTLPMKSLGLTSQQTNIGSGLHITVLHSTNITFGGHYCTFFSFYTHINIFKYQASIYIT